MSPAVLRVCRLFGVVFPSLPLAIGIGICVLVGRMAAHMHAGTCLLCIVHNPVPQLASQAKHTR
jgi:hypothetical protein